MLVGAIMLLTACSSMPLSTMFKMIRLNPLDIDPRELVVAVHVPQGMKVRDGNIVIDFKFDTGQPTNSFTHKFLVTVNADYQIPPALTEDLSPNEHITVLQLSKQDAETMYQAQQTVKAYRENNDDGVGSFGLKLNSACRDKNFSINDSNLDLFVKLKDDEEFFVFIEDLNLADMTSGAEDILANIPNCSSP